MPAPSVITIGTFDGVHRGHQALIRRARERAAALGAGAGVAALVFDPNPIEVLRPEHAPARLTTFDQKREFLLAAGAHEVHRLEPTDRLLHETPEEFLTLITAEHRVAGIVEGPDFRFGKGRAGDTRTLAALAPRFGYTLDIVEPVAVALNDHTIAPARSTMVRWLLSHGRVADAANILGRPHTLRGTVTRGDRRGRTIGYPTANLDTPCMPPADGVYAGLARLPGGRTLTAAISVGTKPTFGAHRRTVEAYLFPPGQTSPLFASPSRPSSSDSAWSPLPDLPEYDWPLDLEFHAYIRDQLKFSSLDDLLAQMDRDCNRIDDLMRLRAAEPALDLTETPA